MTNAATYNVGRYVIRIARRGRGFEFDVLTNGGLLVAVGFDLLSLTTAAVFDAIAPRYGGSIQCQ